MFRRFKAWRAKRRVEAAARNTLYANRNAAGLCGECGTHPFAYDNGICEGCDLEYRL